MRRQVAASSAGSSLRRGSSLGFVAHRLRRSRPAAGASRAVSHRLIGIALVAVALVFAFASTALASRVYQSQLTQANSTDFTNPFGLAVDSSDNVWVSDTGTSLVSKFDSSGAFLAQNDGTGSWAGSGFVQDLAFGKTAGLVYAVDSNADDLWGLNQSDATYASVDLNSGLGSGCCFLNATVDNTGGAHDGDIYVGSQLGPNAVIRVDGTGAAVNFSGSASYISGNQITGTPDHVFSAIQSVVVAANGDVWVADQGSAELDRFDSTGIFQQAITFGFSALSDLAIDPTTGDVLVGDTAAGVVHEYDSSGNFIDDIDGSGTPAGSFTPRGIAIDSTGKLYVADGPNAVVDVFGSATQTLTVSKAGSGGGTVTSSPAGIDCGATCSHDFAQGDTVTLTATAAAGSTFTGWSGPGAASCPGTGTCDVTIPTAATSVTATFAQSPPTVTTTAGATAITQHAATVAGTVNPNSGTVTNCHIDYGKTTSYGSQKPCSPAAPGAGTSPVAVSAALSGLAAGTTYHFRVVATNVGGTAHGSDQTFKTLADTCATNAGLCPPPPTCATDPSLCPPASGTLKLGVAVATVRGGKAAVKLSCSGAAACTGTVKLTAKVKVRKGKKKITKTITIGKANIDIAAGASATVKIRLSHAASKLIAKKHRLKATLIGPDLKHAIVLKLKKK